MNAVVAAVAALPPPIELRELKAWITWAYETKPGEEKPRKIPYYANGVVRHGTQGSPEDRAQLVAYEEACAVAIKRALGVGIAMLADNDMTGVDFDNCVKDGVVPPDIHRLCAPTYAEYSPSGNGVRAFFRGRVQTLQTKGLEAYSNTQFLTVTGKQIPGTASVIAPLTDEMRAAIEARRPARSSSGAAPANNDGPIPEGMRDATLNQMAFRMYRAGLDHDAVFAALRATNDTRCQPPLDDADIERLARPRKEAVPDLQPWQVGLGTGPAPAGMSLVPIPPRSVPVGIAPSRFTPVDAWTYADGPDPRWRVDGLLPEQGLAMIFGPSGAGKSFFMLDMMMAIARGIPYGHAQHAVLPGRVVYIVSEGAGGFRKRLRAYRTLHKLPPGSPCPRLITVAPNFMNATDVSELQTAVMSTGGADVVVIDTLHASVAGADENSAKDMGVLLGHCRAVQSVTGGLVILIHHSGKDEERGARGSSSIRAAMDTEIEVVGGGGEFSIALITKQRDGDTEGSVYFKLTKVALVGDRPGTSAAVEHIPRPEREKEERKRRASDEQSLGVQQLQLMLSSGLYPDGVALEVLVMAIHKQRPDMRPDSIKRSISRAIDSGRLVYGSEQRLTLPTVHPPQIMAPPISPTGVHR